jgi:succinyl-diaminopimelate desuccinylase
MNTSILTLTKKFISIESTATNPAGLQEILQLAISQLRGFTIEHFEKNGIKSILVYTAKKRPKKFSVILNGHLDVVPGKKEHYQPRSQGDRLYGVGSMDMKANVACLIAAFKEVAPRLSYPVALQLVTDEEVGGFNGTKYQVEQGVRTDFVIAGEPTNFDIVRAAKGILQVEISASGTTAHGAYPWRGENAVWKMHQFLNTLKKKYPTPKKQVWATTVNLSSIKTSNDAFNKIPDDCTVRLDIRYVARDRKTILPTLKKLLPKNFTLRVCAKEPALDTTAASPYVEKLADITQQVTRKKTILRGANGSSDARHFAPVGCPGIEFGPIGGDIGGDKEWVSIKSLGEYQRILTNFLLSLN